MLVGLMPFGVDVITSVLISLYYVLTVHTINHICDLSCRPTHAALHHVSCRLKLAALHFNENCNRPQAVTKQGVAQYDIVQPKYKKGGHLVRKIHVKATYGMN